MKYLWENDWFFVPIALFFGFCGVSALLVPYSQELLFFNDFRSEPLNSIMYGITHGGEVVAYVVFGVAVYFWKPRYALLVVLLGLMSMPIMYFLKDTIGVDRPITYFEKNSILTQLILVPDIYMNRGQTSFPSGHSMAAFALYSLLTLMAGRKYARWGLVFALMAISVGLSRIFLVQHFLIDVLAGGFCGLLLGNASWLAAQKWLFPKAEQGSAST